MVHCLTYIHYSPTYHYRSIMLDTVHSPSYICDRPTLCCHSILTQSTL